MIDGISIVIGSIAWILLSGLLMIGFVHGWWWP